MSILILILNFNNKLPNQHAPPNCRTSILDEFSRAWNIVKERLEFIPHSFVKR